MDTPRELKEYERHTGNDLRATLDLIYAFEKRFQRSVEGGVETISDNKRIRHQRQLFQAAKTESDKQVYGSMLAVNLYHRMITNIARHIEYRILENEQKEEAEQREARAKAVGNGKDATLKELKEAIDRDYEQYQANRPASDPKHIEDLFHKLIGSLGGYVGFRTTDLKSEELNKRETKITHHLREAFGLEKLNGNTPLDKLSSAIENDFREVSDLFPHLRRLGGKKDKDDVLNEMRGEPFNLFCATISRTPENNLEQFYTNREKKIKTCWRDIDNSTAAIKQLVSTSGHLQKSRLPKLIDELSESAKNRAELMRSNYEFDEAAGDLRSAHNQIREFELSGNYYERKRDDRIMDLVQKYRKLVYDLAHIRNDRETSTNALLTAIEKETIRIPKKQQFFDFKDAEKPFTQKYLNFGDEEPKVQR